MTANAPTWTPDQPLRADADNDQVVRRFTKLESETRYTPNAIFIVAREYAVAKVLAYIDGLHAAAPAPHEDTVRLLPKPLGARLARLREAAHLTQSGLARLVGISQSAVSQIESGERNPSYGMLVQLADGVGVTTSFLVGDDSATAPLAQDHRRNGSEVEYIAHADLLAQPSVRSEEEPVAWRVEAGGIPSDTWIKEDYADVKVYDGHKNFTVTPLYERPQPLPQEGSTRRMPTLDTALSDPGVCHSFDAAHQDIVATGRTDLTYVVRAVLALFPKVTDHG